jgi:hypothetical protein
MLFDYPIVGHFRYDGPWTGLVETVERGIRNTSNGCGRLSKRDWYRCPVGIERNLG